MALEALDEGLVDHQETDAHTARHFYFIKFNRSFVEPFLERKMVFIKRNMECLEEQKTLLLKNKRLLRETSVIKYVINLDYRLGNYKDDWRDVGHVKKIADELVKYWPESINEDPKDEEDPDIELSEIENKLEKLMYQLKHLNCNAAEAKRKIRETQPLQERKEKLIKDLKDAEARTPPRKQRDHWHKDDNYKCYLRRRLRNVLTSKVRDYIESEREFDRRNVEASLDHVQRQLTAENEGMIAVQKDIKKQVAQYNEVIKKGNELALIKDTVALEELSCKQVEKIMSRWNGDKTFRANYKRSVAISLRRRGLSGDGRQLELDYVKNI